MQLKLVAFAVFIFSLTYSSANPILGTHSTRAANTPEFYKRLKQELQLQQWTTGSWNPNRKLLQTDNQGDILLETIRDKEYSDVEDLLRAGADPNYTEEGGWDALTVAIGNDRGEVVTLLINYGADVKGAPGSNLERAGALQFASGRDSTAAAAALLAAGVPIDGITNGFSALHACGLTGAVKLAELLLDNGATIDLYTDTKDPITALHIAVEHKHLSVVKLLLSRGANIKGRTKTYGDTPLHDAAQENAALIVQVLLDSGADVDATDYNGRTPLWDAAYRGNKNALEVLVINGADKSISAFGQSPGEVLCRCVKLDEVPAGCKVEECENPFGMQQILKD